CLNNHYGAFLGGGLKTNIAWATILTYQMKMRMFSFAFTKMHVTPIQHNMIAAEETIKRRYVEIMENTICLYDSLISEYSFDLYHLQLLVLKTYGGISFHFLHSTCMVHMEVFMDFDPNYTKLYILKYQSNILNIPWLHEGAIIHQVPADLARQGWSPQRWSRKMVLYMSNFGQDRLKKVIILIDPKSYLMHIFHLHYRLIKDKL
ncbi:hypothetical protein ACJX0J_027630, partial [Zea mays]